MARSTLADWRGGFSKYFWPLCGRAHSVCRNGSGERLANRIGVVAVVGGTVARAERACYFGGRMQSSVMKDLGMLGKVRGEYEGRSPVRRVLMRAATYTSSPTKSSPTHRSIIRLIGATLPRRSALEG